jgi:hypothetical protein
MRWKNRPNGSNWGEFGIDDQLGRVNLINADCVVRGAREIVAGLSFSLSLPLNIPGGSKVSPRRHPPVLMPTSYDGKPFFNLPFSKINALAIDVVSDDQVLMCLQYSTQWDALAHVGALFDVDGDGKEESVYYNGFAAGEHIVGPSNFPPDAIYSPCADPDGKSNAGALGMKILQRKECKGVACF